MNKESRMNYKKIEDYGVLLMLLFLLLAYGSLSQKHSELKDYVYDMNKKQLEFNEQVLISGEALKEFQKLQLENNTLQAEAITMCLEQKQLN